MSNEELVQQAMKVRQLAYAPYSNFAVGAALLTDSGAIFSGCNVENSVLGLSICAERSAVLQAVAAGQCSFKMIAIAAHPLAPPCGPCRQFLIEFNPHLEVVSVDAGEPAIRKSWNLAELLPDHFSLRRD